MIMQDVYLTGNPQITFFKVVYRRHTNFAMEAIEQTFSGSPDFDKTVQCQIVRNGDLVTKMYLKVKLPTVTAESGHTVAWTPKVGLALIDSVELEIGGSRIDKHYGDWMNVWYELTRQPGQDRGHDMMVGNDAATVTMASKVEEKQLYVPLQFFHCRNDGLALPLIALQYHDVRVNFKFRKASELLCHTQTSAPSGLSLKDASLLVNYVYLDSEERKRFAQASHEYLIEQLQFTGSETVSTTRPKIRLNFNHPCKELVWTLSFDKWTDGKKFLAWNPTDFAAMRDEATRKYLAMCAKWNGANITVTSSTNSAIVGNAGTTSTFTDLKGQVIGAITDIGSTTGNVVVNATYNDITYEVPLSWAQISTDVTTLLSSVTTTQTAATGYPVYVRDWFNYASNINHEGNPISAVLLQLNGHDRFEEQDGNYFNYVQPWEAHSATPSDGVNVYSFALNPEDHQPSGTCNFSRIDNATLNLTLPDNSVNSDTKQATLNVYAVNYNVLRVMSGMGGLAYSN